MCRHGMCFRLGVHHGLAVLRASTVIMISKLKPNREEANPRRSSLLSSIGKMRRLMSLALLSVSLLTIAGALAPTANAASDGETKFKRIPTQFIAALGDPTARSGLGAESWGLWTIDPGPRGVWLKSYEQLKTAGGAAPAEWQFDNTDWWLEENGLIMEKPDFPLPPGKYIVTGDRDAYSELTVHPVDESGAHRWELNNGARLYDVTHLPCRSARYTPTSENSCSPAEGATVRFPSDSRRRPCRPSRVATNKTTRCSS